MAGMASFTKDNMRYSSNIEMPKVRTDRVAVGVAPLVSAIPAATVREHGGVARFRPPTD